MKRVIAIWLLLLYTQAALGISFDSCACGQKQVKIVLFRLSTACASCGGHTSAMGCCQTASCFGKADQHKLPLATELPLPSLSPEKGGKNVFNLQLVELAAATDVQFSHYGPVRPSSPRAILTLVQSFRI